MKKRMKYDYTPTKRSQNNVTFMWRKLLTAHHHIDPTLCKSSAKAK